MKCSLLLLHPEEGCEQSIEVNEIFAALCCVSITPRPLPPPPVCAGPLSRNAVPLPRDRRGPTRTSPGSWPSDTERPWRGALLFPSRGWRGASFPPLPFRTQTGMYLGQPGRGRTCPGPAGGKGVAMTASFRFLAFLSSAASSLARLSPEDGVEGARVLPAGPPPRQALHGTRRPPASPPPVRTHISGSPRRASQAGSPPSEKGRGAVHGRRALLVFLPFR